MCGSCSPLFIHMLWRLHPSGGQSGERMARPLPCGVLSWALCLYCGMSVLTNCFNDEVAEATASCLQLNNSDRLELELGLTKRGVKARI